MVSLVIATTEDSLALFSVIAALVQTSDEYIVAFTTILFTQRQENLVNVAECCNCNGHRWCFKDVLTAFRHLVSSYIQVCIEVLHPGGPVNQDMLIL